MLSVIGDVHGKSNDYLALARKLEGAGNKTVQLGDMGFNYAHMGNLDWQKHRFFKGNHDNQNAANAYDLGRYGYFDEWDDCPPFFWVSGGFSVDKQHRTSGIDWWPEEELTLEEGRKALALYKEIQPEVLITHEPPYLWGREIGNPSVLRWFGFDPDAFFTNTAALIQEMIAWKAPKILVCGHFHIDRIDKTPDTTYICLAELSCININKELQIQ